VGFSTDIPVTRIEEKGKPNEIDDGLTDIRTDWHP
jgi:hypothetical protein